MKIQILDSNNKVRKTFYRSEFNKWLYGVCCECSANADNTKSINSKITLWRNIEYNGIAIARELGFNIWVA